MDRIRILNIAACIVVEKRGLLKLSLNTAIELKNDELKTFWAEQLAECDAVYRGLVDIQVREMSLREDSE